MSFLKGCFRLILVSLIAVELFTQPLTAITINTNRDTGGDQENTGTFIFTDLDPVPSNSYVDLAQGITPVNVLGSSTGNGNPNAVLGNLTDGTVGLNGDDIPRTFFFTNTVDPGKIRITLPMAATITQVNTYSWHGGSRAPQDYDLYASSGGGVFDINDESVGWTLLGSVDTLLLGTGGQHGVSFVPSSGSSLGSFRHFMFVTSFATGIDNTFFQEFDIHGTFVPEPSTYALIGSLVGLVLLARGRSLPKGVW